MCPLDWCSHSSCAAVTLSHGSFLLHSSTVPSKSTLLIHNLSAFLDVCIWNPSLIVSQVGPWKPSQEHRKVNAKKVYYMALLFRERAEDSLSSPQNYGRESSGILLRRQRVVPARLAITNLRLRSPQLLLAPTTLFILCWFTPEIYFYEQWTFFVTFPHLTFIIKSLPKTHINTIIAYITFFNINYLRYFFHFYLFLFCYISFEMCMGENVSYFYVVSHRP